MLNRHFYLTIIDDFFTEYECDYLVEWGKDKLERSRVGVERKISDIRTSKQCWLPTNENKIIYDLTHRVAEEVKTPFENAESVQILSYTEQQEYRPHYDSWELDTPERIKHAQGWGQRVKTALVYLNDVEEGGATVFPKLGITVPPKKGRMVIFKNIDEDNPNFPMYESLHGGLPVEKGQKWACNFWFHQYPASLRRTD